MYKHNCSDNSYVVIDGLVKIKVVNDVILIDAPKEVKIETFKGDFFGLGNNRQESQHSGAPDTVHENKEIK